MIYYTSFTPMHISPIKHAIKSLYQNINIVNFYLHGNKISELTINNFTHE